jgi:hypothetical protein
VELADGMLFVELMKAGGDWLWCSDMIDNKSEFALGCLGEFVAEKARGRIENIGYEPMPIALCDSLLWMMTVAGASWSLAPSFF